MPLVYQNLYKLAGCGRSATARIAQTRGCGVQGGGLPQDLADLGGSFPPFRPVRRIGHDALAGTEPGREFRPVDAALDGSRGREPSAVLLVLCQAALALLLRAELEIVGGVGIPA